MRGPSFEDAGGLYRTARLAKVERRFVACPELGHFGAKFRDFRDGLGESRADGYWRGTLRLLWQVWRGGTGTPLPYGSESLAPERLLREARVRLTQCGGAYPAVATSAVALLSALDVLLLVEVNPLLLAARRAASANDPTAILTREARLIPAVEAELAKAAPELTFRVVSEAELAGALNFDCMLIIGAIQWFSKGVLQSPRARRISVITPGFIRDYWRGKPVFEGCLYDGKSLIARTIDVLTEPAGPVDVADVVLETLDEFEAEEVVPRVDWEAEAARVAAAIVPTDYEDISEARLVVLDDGTAVFLEDSDSAKALALDLRELGGGGEARNAVSRVPVRDLHQGMFLLVRTSGGGDYVVAVADRILGKLAATVRKSQSDWKTKLRAEVREHGLTDVTLRLMYLEAPLAREMNVRNWMSERNIRPRNKADFAAILALVALDDKVEEYWRNARIIDAAHRKAGFRIRNRLMQQVERADLNALVKLGRMDFDLGDEGGGRLTAWRVAEVSQALHIVAASQLGRPFEAGD